MNVKYVEKLSCMIFYESYKYKITIKRLILHLDIDFKGSVNYRLIWSTIMIIISKLRKF